MKYEIIEYFRYVDDILLTYKKKTIIDETSSEFNKKEPI
jgi:hypothetical protein